MRPRCCFRYFTFFGINIESALFCHPEAPSFGAEGPGRRANRSRSLRATKSRVWRASLKSARRRNHFPLLLLQDLALVDPALHPNDAVSRARFTEAKVDVGPQRVQRQTPLQIPLRTRDFVAVQSSAHANFDSLA